MILAPDRKVFYDSIPLRQVRSKIAAVIDTQEQRSSVLKEKCARVAGQKETKIGEIEAAFAKIQAALDQRKKTLLGMVEENSAKSRSPSCIWRLFR